MSNPFPIRALSLGCALLATACGQAPCPPPGAPSPAPASGDPMAFWVGQWGASFAATQEFATLEILPGGRFRGGWQLGPDGECRAEGSVRITERRLELTVEKGNCPKNGSALWNYPVIWARADNVVILTQAGLSANIGVVGENALSGPLWILTRATSDADKPAKAADKP